MFELSIVIPGSRPKFLPLALFTMAALLSGCGANNGSTGKPGPAAMPATEVGVVTVTPTDVALITELPGRLEASRIAQVRARAAGIVQQRRFVEGTEVKAGQALFQIDAAPYQAALASAQAALAKAQANLLQASTRAERFKRLAQDKMVSEMDLINAQSAHNQALADVGMAQAGVQTARINLGYTAIVAPISGRIGRALVSEGALVGQGEATQLALIQQINPLYINFTQSADEVMKLQTAQASGQFKRAGAQAAQVRVILPDGSQYAHAGKLLFSDLSVDTTSGQITLRAELPNPGGVLLPGLYVRVRLEQAQAGNAIVLPQQAVTRSGQGDSVLVVGSDGKISQRTVKIGAQQNAQWVVLGGLKAGEQVMVDGFQKVAMLPPGTAVKAVAWHSTAPQTAGVAAAAR